MSFKLYGTCPQCGADVISRERRLNGNDTCSAGHVFPSLIGLGGLMGLMPSQANDPKGGLMITRRTEEAVVVLDRTTGKEIGRVIVARILDNRISLVFKFDKQYRINRDPS